jgi:hypothetical protein
MRISAFSALALVLGISVVQLSACSNSAEDCNALATCGAAAGTSQAGSAGKSGGGSGASGGDASGGSSSGAGASNTSGTSGSMGGGGEGGGGGGTCTGDVSSESACWTNELGVFVSSDAGDDSGAGTKEAPFKTIKKGIEAAAGKHVYVCVGTNDYKEATISLKLANDGIRIYGGFECSSWTYATTRSAQVVSESNIALRIDGLKTGAHIENVSFQAADATLTGVDASSYGAFVTGSKGVVFTRVTLIAGAGAKGGDGDAGTKGADAAAAGVLQSGNPALCGGTPPSADGGLWAGPTCGSKGGDGGKAVLDSAGGSGFSGIPAQNVTPPNVVNLGAGATDGTKGKDGTDGSPGDAGTLGAAAADAGTFAMTGFSPASGHDGGAGFPGQGGGGGGASKGSPTCRGASGGAGGMGGCAGEPGKAGEGGGASVGLFSWSSEVSLVASVHGVSKPIYDADTMLTSGTPGAAGVGGQQVSTTKAPDGSVGKAGAEFQVQ